MMSRERIFSITEKIADEFKKSGVKVKDSRKLKSAMIAAFTEEMKFFEALDREARERIERMRKKVVEGTGEWQALYQRFFEEAFSKRVRL